jgi:PAS domain S-box-containing protein
LACTILTKKPLALSVFGLGWRGFLSIIRIPDDNVIQGQGKSINLEYAFQNTAIAIADAGTHTCDTSHHPAHMSNPRQNRLNNLREQAQLAMSRMGPSATQQAFEAMELPRLIEELRIYHEELEIQNEELSLAHTKSDSARARYQLLFSLMPIPTLLLEGFGVIVEDNDASQDWLGPPRRYQHHDLRLNQALSREDRPRLNRMLSLLEPMGKGALSNLTLTGFDQSERRVDLHAARLPQDFHQEARFLIVLLDRTVEKARLSEHGVFNALLDSSEDLTFATDPYGRLMLANQTFLNRLGVARERALGRKLAELLPPSASALYLSKGEERPSQYPDSSFETVQWPDDATPSQLAVRRFPIRNRRNEIIGHATTCRDTAQENHNTGAKDLAHQALMALPLAVAICNEQGVLETVNAEFEAQTGFSMAALAGRTLDRIFPPEQPDSSMATVWTQLRAHSHWQGPRHLRRSDGRLWTAQASVQRLIPRTGPAPTLAVWVFYPLCTQA